MCETSAYIESDQEIWFLFGGGFGQNNRDPTVFFNRNCDFWDNITQKGTVRHVILDKTCYHVQITLNFQETVCLLQKHGGSTDFCSQQRTARCIRCRQLIMAIFNSPATFLCTNPTCFFCLKKQKQMNSSTQKVTKILIATSKS